MADNTKGLPSLNISNDTMLQDQNTPPAPASAPATRAIKISQVNFRKIPLLANLTDEELDAQDRELEEVYKTLCELDPEITKKYGVQRPRSTAGGTQVD